MVILLEREGERGRERDKIKREEGRERERESFLTSHGLLRFD